MGRQDLHRRAHAEAGGQQASRAGRRAPSLASGVREMLVEVEAVPLKSRNQ